MDLEHPDGQTRELLHRTAWRRPEAAELLVEILRIVPTGRNTQLCYDLIEQEWLIAHRRNPEAKRKQLAKEVLRKVLTKIEAGDIPFDT